MQDPTRKEMLSYLNTLPFADQFDEFDREEAIYWFASDYQSGQASNLYSALSVSPFNPEPFATCVSETAERLYDALETEFAA